MSYGTSAPTIPATGQLHCDSHIYSIASGSIPGWRASPARRRATIRSRPAPSPRTSRFSRMCHRWGCPMRRSWIRCGCDSSMMRADRRRAKFSPGSSGRAGARSHRLRRPRMPTAWPLPSGRSGLRQVPIEVEVRTPQDSAATWHTNAEAFRVDQLDSNYGLGCGIKQGDLWCWGGVVGLDAIGVERTRRMYGVGSIRRPASWRKARDSRTSQLGTSRSVASIRRAPSAAMASTLKSHRSRRCRRCAGSPAGRLRSTAA